MLETYQIAVSLFPNWTLAQHLHAWRRQRKGKPIMPGELFLAPDGQLFRTGIKQFLTPTPIPGAKRKAKRVVVLRWHSHCRVCAAPYAFPKDIRATNLIRTCLAHRGTSGWHRSAPIRALILSELHQAAANSASAPVVSFIDHCIGMLPRPAGRDTRRQRIVRALQDLIDKGRMPCGVTDDSFVFAPCN